MITRCQYSANISMSCIPLVEIMMPIIPCRARAIMEKMISFFIHLLICPKMSRDCLCKQPLVWNEMRVIKGRQKAMR